MKVVKLAARDEIFYIFKKAFINLNITSNSCLTRSFVNGLSTSDLRLWSIILFKFFNYCIAFSIATACATTEPVNIRTRSNSLPRIDFTENDRKKMLHYAYLHFGVDPNSVSKPYICICNYVFVCFGGKYYFSQRLAANNFSMLSSWKLLI